MISPEEQQRLPGAAVAFDFREPVIQEVEEALHLRRRNWKTQLDLVAFGVP
jgi:hypothetical protein